MKSEKQIENKLKEVKERKSVSYTNLDKLWGKQKILEWVLEGE